MTFKALAAAVVGAVSLIVASPAVAAPAAKVTAAPEKVAPIKAGKEDVKPLGFALGETTLDEVVVQAKKQGWRILFEGSLIANQEETVPAKYIADDKSQVIDFVGVPATHVNKARFEFFNKILYSIIYVIESSETNRDTIAEALRSKYGEPVYESTEERVTTWAFVYTAVRVDSGTVEFEHSPTKNRASRHRVNLVEQHKKAQTVRLQGY